MKRCFFFLVLLTNCVSLNAQSLDSLFEKGLDKSIINIYSASAVTFDNNELEIVAAAYDKLERLSEEDKVLSNIINGFPLFLTYTIPANFMYYGNFINAGLMEKYKTLITNQYLASIKNTSLGAKILNMFYRDQGVRQKYDANVYCRRNNIQTKWDSTKLLQEWVKIDSSNLKWTAKIISDNKGFPSKANIGLIGTNSLFIVMQHLDTSYRGRYDKILFEAACKKDISMTDYAMYKTMTLVRTHQIPDSLFQNTLDSISESKCD